MPAGGRRHVGAGRYELIERIGRGATGEVFRARDRAGGVPREVCIKRLLLVLAEEHAAALREEARVLAGIRHSNVVSLLELAHDDDGLPFLVLELIDGCDLRTLTRLMDVEEREPAHRGFLPDPVAVHVVCGVLRGLLGVQRAMPGLVHRDVTPPNVLVSREGEVKLSDFGIARARDRARSTRPCVVKGKLGYLAPEQARDEHLDPRCDLFAVGVMLYELLARSRPWGAARGMAELHALQCGEQVPLTRLRPDLPVPLLRAIDRLLAPRREARFDTPGDALRALAPFSAGDLGSLRLAALLGRLRGLAPSAPSAPSDGGVP